MTIGDAITAAMREQRRADLTDMAWFSKHGLTDRQQNLLKAYNWWGWNINGSGGIGVPGLDA